VSVILGITDGDDAGAVLLVDGRLVAAVNEERLNRMKMSIGFPTLSVQEVLRISGRRGAEVDRVAVAAHAESFRPLPRANKGWFQEETAVARIRDEISSALAKPLGNSRVARGAYRHIKRMTLGRRKTGVRRLLAELGVTAPIGYHDHHLCHAIAAFWCSGFEDAVSISLDGGGDGCSSHVYAADQHGHRLLNKLDSFDSIGNYYAYVTHLCGFRASIHEGKITGLAASGEPIYRAMFAKLVDFEAGQIRNKGKLFYRTAVSALRNLLPEEWEHQDLAASIQQHLEHVGVAYVRHWMEESGKRKVCLSGGVFGNVLLNQRIADLPGCEGAFVFPAMGDGGLAAGAAYAEYMKLPGAKGPLEEGSALEHVYLGGSFGDAEIEKALDESGFPYRKLPDIETTVARLVHEGKVVARFNGAMEYGPRALGNRTLLYRTSDRSVNTWLNKRLNRTEFMPFAPACLAGHERQLFHWNPASARSARFMTITADCTEWMRERCPAVVHVDGTARPQLVDEAANPSFHRIIAKYHEISGVPVVVNTSFNMHEEPIVCTPGDAIRAWNRGRLDNLALGSYLVGPPPRESD